MQVGLLATKQDLLLGLPACVLPPEWLEACCNAWTLRWATASWLDLSCVQMGAWSSRPGSEPAVTQAVTQRLPVLNLIFICTFLSWKKKEALRVTLRFNVLAAATCLNFFLPPFTFCCGWANGPFCRLVWCWTVPAMEACDVSVSVQFCIAAACVVWSLR